jgi:predicted DNA-binding transcriptional regulator AlpA
MSTVVSPQAILNAQDAARYLGVARSTFLRSIAPDLPRVQLTPGRVGFTRADLDAWIAIRREAPVED